MTITVQNTTDLPNKHIRRLKYQLYNIAEKFNHVIYAHVHVNQEGQGFPIYELSLQIGVPGPDVILKNRSTNIQELFKKACKDAFRYCRKTKPQSS